MVYSVENMQYQYYRFTDLIDRLCHAADRRDRTVTFLVGSPISAPDHIGAHGVPGVTGMVDLIRNEFHGTDAETELDKGLHDSVQPYQTAFEFLHAKRGQDAVNGIVRGSVWQALNANNWPSFLPATTPEEADPATCRALERQCDAWILPTAVDLFGDLLVTCFDTFGRAVLTTNFDPLIEVSVAKHGGQYYRTVLHGDGRLGQTAADGTHIVHLHGHWCDSDTLHTPPQLLHPRPQLTRSLAQVVRTSTLVVIGYGGWDDVVSRALVELLDDPASSGEILWAFHADDAHITRANGRLLATMGPGIGRGRVSLFHSVDCRVLFSELLKQLKPSYPTATGSGDGPRITAKVRKQLGAGAEPARMRLAIDFPIPPLETSRSDSPLLVDCWVGRVSEFRFLASTTTPAAFITGLGGQGKSALAGRFLQEHAMSEGAPYEFWDWRDCREESDRLGTQVLRLIERLSDGAIDASRIEATNMKAVVGILFQVLRDRKALLVFDNVDQYIDLETLRPIKGLEVLVAEAQARTHRSLFLFTCRPDVTIDESRTTKIVLDGLTESETEELIKARGVPNRDLYLAKELRQVTSGHPLWLNLVTMQGLRHTNGLRGALDVTRRGGGTLPATTRTIWEVLNQHQRNVLRTMAELDRPEPETRLLEFLPGLNVNRVSRALKTLRSFHLIEVWTQPEGEPHLGLHPLIRKFVWTNFPRREREKYVGAVLGFFERMVARFRGLLDKEPAYQILEHWTRKADLQITIGHLEDATSTIEEVGRALVNRGYSEEFVRLALRLMSAINWGEACSSYKDFDEVFSRCLKAMVELGHGGIDDLLTRYEDGIPGKSSQFILLCDLRCYAAWYNGEFEAAVQWGERGARLKEESSVDTSFSTDHNLALSRRDAGRVAEALESFLDGESLGVVVSLEHRSEDRTAYFYGNIGRCLYLMERFEEALVCYTRSAQLLEAGRDHLDRVNRGYIRHWLAEVFVKQGELDLGAAAYRAAACAWKDCSPPRAAEAEAALEALVAEHAELQGYVDQADWRAEGAFAEWLSRQ